MLRCYALVFRKVRLKGVPRSPCAFLPIEFTSLLQAMLCRDSSCNLPLSHPVQPLGHAFIVAGIEQRIRPPNDVRDA